MPRSRASKIILLTFFSALSIFLVASLIRTSFNSKPHNEIARTCVNGHTVQTIRNPIAGVETIVTDDDSHGFRVHLHGDVPTDKAVALHNEIVEKLK